MRASGGIPESFWRRMICPPIGGLCCLLHVNGCEHMENHVAGH